MTAEALSTSGLGRGYWCTERHAEGRHQYASRHWHPPVRVSSKPSVAPVPAPEGSLVPLGQSRDYRRRLSFDFRIIADAQEHYEALGYEDVAVPWVISREAMDATLPTDKVPYGTFGGFLVGSAEQSFIDMLLSGAELGRVQATTPCFRDERHDELHSPYFMKTELFDGLLPPTEESVLSVVEDAKTFFERYLRVAIQREGELAWDLVEYDSGIELGSYGVRQIPGHSWIYGTGVALPRLQQVLDQQ